MSPIAPWLSECQLSFPRVSGDEPILGLPKLREKWFSPRERG